MTEQQEHRHEGETPSDQHGAEQPLTPEQQQERLEQERLQRRKEFLQQFRVGAKP